MTPMEITLLIVGVIIFCISFIIKDGNDAGRESIDENVLRDEIRRVTDKEYDSMSLKVKEATDSAVEYAMEKSERALEKISNEKIMAVSEYSNTILDEINKSHKEVMFLYDMLTDKQTDLKNTVRKAEATAKEVNDAEKKATEVRKKRKKKEEDFEPVEMIKEIIDKEEEERVLPEKAIGPNHEMPDNNNDKIIELHKKGRTNVEIAKELNLGVGEVTLVIDLFER
ncbi:MAG: hypothetical protein IJT80_01360 [Lachnospiraceae bacterium]|nr:hypothetical protein [Lachnospiraceae bacterium]